MSQRLGSHDMHRGCLLSLFSCYFLTLAVTLFVAAAAGNSASHRSKEKTSDRRSHEPYEVALFYAEVINCRLCRAQVIGSERLKLEGRYGYYACSYQGRIFFHSIVRTRPALQAFRPSSAGAFLAPRYRSTASSFFLHSSLVVLF